MTANSPVAPYHQNVILISNNKCNDHRVGARFFVRNARMIEKSLLITSFTMRNKHFDSWVARRKHGRPDHRGPYRPDRVPGGAGVDLKPGQGILGAGSRISFVSARLRVRFPQPKLTTIQESTGVWPGFEGMNYDASKQTACNCNSEAR